MMNQLFIKAAFAFVALPGVVAFAVPILLARPARVDLADVLPGLVPLATGCFLLAWCVREFYVAGRGTLAPWSPPIALVVSGPYRRSRNPMYVAVLLILAGWALVFRSWALVAYAFAISVAFQLRVVYGEEPWLARSFGDGWVSYRQAVPRWLVRTSRR